MSDFRRCCLGTDELVRIQCMSVVWICFDVLCFLHSWDNHRNMANVFKQFPICPNYFPIFPKYFPIFPNISQTCPKYVWFPVLSTHHGAWMSHPAAGCLGIPWEPAILAMYSSERHAHTYIYFRYGSGLFKSGILTYQNGALEPIKGFVEPAVKFLEPLVYKSGSFYYV